MALALALSSRPASGQPLPSLPLQAPEPCDPRPLTIPIAEFFTDVSVEAGLKPSDDSSWPPEGVIVSHPRAAAADVDGDGWDDLVFHNMFPGVRDGREPFEHLVWRNNGDGTFSEVSEQIGLRDAQVAWLVFGDLDNDGDPDAIGGIDFTGYPAGAPGFAEQQPTHEVWLQDDAGVFQEVPSSGIHRSLGSDLSGTRVFGAGTATLADFDGDSNLDLYLGNGQTSYALRDQLFIGQGDGTFIDESRRLEGSEDWPSNGSVACDIDGDRDADLFVSVYGVSLNGAQNQLFVNDGTGLFSEEGVTRGVASQPGGNTWRRDLDYGKLPEPDAEPGEYIGGNGFGVDCSDVDSDGDLDLLFVAISHSTELPYPFRDWTREQVEAANYTRRWSDPTHLLINDGTGHFTAVWSDWGLPYNEGDIDGSLADFDNDGGMDIGLSRDAKYEASYSTWDQLAWFGLLRLDEPASYESIGQASGINDPTETGASRHMTGGGNVNWTDYDRDGDLDLAVGGGPRTLGGHLFSNEVGNENDWLAIRLSGDGVAVNRDAIGTTTQVKHAEAGTHMSRYLVASRGTYNSADTKVQHFGLGTTPCDYVLVVNWPDGTSEGWAETDAGRNRYLRVDYGRGLVGLSATGEALGEPIPGRPVDELLGEMPTPTPWPTASPEPSATAKPSPTPVPRWSLWLPLVLDAAPVR